MKPKDILKGITDAMRSLGQPDWPRFYDLHGGRITEAEASLISHDERRLGRDVLPDGRLVSTVFLALDHGDGLGPPLIFETMVFSDEHNLIEQSCVRYSTFDEARAGHVRTVEELWATIPQ